MERRVVFAGWLFPVALLLPQLAVTLSLLLLAGGAGGPAIAAARGRVRAVRAVCRARQFRRVLADPAYVNSIAVTALFSLCVAVLALRPGCCWR